jgi:hypothetical protein
MSAQNCSFEKPQSSRKLARQRGVALLITLGLLALLGAASLAIIYLTSSDAMINGYYRNYRGSFYAADSGVNVVTEAMRQAVANAGNAAVDAPLPISGAVPTANLLPVPGTATIPATFTQSYAPFLGNTNATTYNIGDTGSWTSQFYLASGGFTPNAATYYVKCASGDGNCYCTSESASCCPANAGCVVCPGVANCYTDGNFSWTFSYPYSVTVTGESSGNENEQVTETGIITYTSSPGNTASGGLPSFSHWAGFIDQYTLCDAGLVQGTMYGPFFTNGSWNFAKGSPGYTFNGSVGQSGTQVGYINGGCTKGGATPPAGYSIHFNDGFTVGANQVQAPTDSYNQEEAVLDGKGAAPCTSNPCGNGQRSAPYTAFMSSVMQTVSGTPYSSSTTGVFIPMYTNSQGQLTFGSNPNIQVSGPNGVQQGDGTGGGFYVNGNASISLSATTTSGHATQTYTITQGATTTTIVVDNTAGTTTVKQGSGSPLTLQGVPTQVDPNTGQAITQDDPSGNPVDPTMIYVNGTVNALSGTVQNNVGVTITATSDVDITGNITYSSQPVNSSDQIISTSNAGVLGIYTPGNVNLEPSSNGGNLTVDASIAMISGQTNGTAGLATPGHSVGTLTIMGGRSEDQAHSVNISTGNTMYDQRFAGNFGPPWFPTAQPTPGASPIGETYAATIQRTGWSENRP